MRFAGSVVSIYAGVLLLLLYGVSTTADGPPSAFRVTFSVLASVGLLGGAALFFRQLMGFAPAALFIGAMLAFGLFLLGRRVWFVVEHGAMDDGSSSPVAFLLGLAWEQVSITVPSLMASFLLWDLAPWSRRRAA